MRAGRLSEIYHRRPPCGPLARVGGHRAAAGRGGHGAHRYRRTVRRRRGLHGGSRQIRGESARARAGWSDARALDGVGVGLRGGASHARGATHPFTPHTQSRIRTDAITHARMPRTRADLGPRHHLVALVARRGLRRARRRHPAGLRVRCDRRASGQIPGRSHPGGRTNVCRAPRLC
jgi:hypothetical protein